MNQIGAYLKAAREEGRLTQEELATRLKITPRYVSDMENDRRKPSLPIFVEMANTLNVSLDRLAGRKP